jgi:hypothetical protein
MPTLALDFDGVISDYTGWRGYKAPFDPPVDGALEAIREYIDNGYDIVVHTSRADSPEQTKRLLAWFKEYGLEPRYLERIAITATKPPAIIYIDDRGWKFDGRFPTIHELKNFKTWKGM